MNVYLAWTFTVLYYAIYPFAKILQWILIALTPVWHGIEFGLLPLVYLGRFVLNTVYLPFAVLGRFEVSIDRAGLNSVHDWLPRWASAEFNRLCTFIWESQD